MVVLLVYKKSSMFSEFENLDENATLMTLSDPNNPNQRLYNIHIVFLARDVIYTSGRGNIPAFTPAN